MSENQRGALVVTRLLTSGFGSSRIVIQQEIFSKSCINRRESPSTSEVPITSHNFLIWDRGNFGVFKRKGKS